MLNTRSMIGLACLLSAGLSPVANAEHGEGGLFISPHIKYVAFDSELDLEAAPGGGIGIGYLFEKTGIEIMWDQVSTENKFFNTIEVDTTTYSLDFLYHFSGSHVSSPYLRLGYGNTEYEVNTVASDEDVGKLGLGYQHWLNESFSFRAELFGTKGLDDAEYENAGILLGFSYLFGGKPKPPPAPVDSDGDRVEDKDDQCPNTPKGARVNSKGCPIDSDGDGVMDNDDRCPGTAKGVTVDDKGCARDSDKDGVLDDYDKCPNSSAGTKVDQEGCEVKLTKTVSITMNVQFDSGSANIRAESYSEIEKVAQFLTQYPSAKAIIEGHTDSQGDANYNLRLSERRAGAVMGALIRNYNIAASRLSSVGYGESRPIADNGTREGRQRNRRVVAAIQATATE